MAGPDKKAKQGRHSVSPGGLKSVQCPPITGSWSMSLERRHADPFVCGAPAVQPHRVCTADRPRAAEPGSRRGHGRGAVGQAPVPQSGRCAGRTGQSPLVGACPPSARTASSRTPARAEGRRSRQAPVRPAWRPGRREGRPQRRREGRRQGRREGRLRRTSSRWRWRSHGRGRNSRPGPRRSRLDRCVRGPAAACDGVGDGAAGLIRQWPRTEAAGVGLAGSGRCAAQPHPGAFDPGVERIEQVVQAERAALFAEHRR